MSALGTIAVSYNGAPITNLVLSRLTIENDYWRDIRDLTVMVTVNPGHQILRDEAMKEGSQRVISWSDRFRVPVQAAQARIAKGEQVDLSPYWGWREYGPMIINRGEKLNITLLVHAVPPAQPLCKPSVDAHGVVLVFTHKKPELHIGSVHIGKALVAGLVITPLIGYGILAHVSDPWQAILLVFLGASITALGAIMITGYRKLRDFVF